MLKKISEDLYIDLDKVIYFSVADGLLILENDQFRIGLSIEQAKDIKDAFDRFYYIN